MRRLILGFFVLTGAIAAVPAQAQTPPPTGTTAAAARPDEYVRTFFLTHAIAQEVQQVLAQLAVSTPGPRPVITMSRSTNSLTIRGTEAVLKMAEDIIRQLDVAPRATPAPTLPVQPVQGQVPSAPPTSRLPRLPELPGSTNIRLELTITDTISGTPATKTVSMVILNGSNGMIRTSTPGQSHMLNVDAIATAYQNGLIGVRLSFEFTPPTPTDDAGRPTGRAPQLLESLTVVVADGKPLVVSQSADAASARTVTASITATVLK